MYFGVFDLLGEEAKLWISRKRMLLYFRPKDKGKMNKETRLSTSIYFFTLIRSSNNGNGPRLMATRLHLKNYKPRRKKISRNIWCMEAIRNRVLSKVVY